MAFFYSQKINPFKMETLKKTINNRFEILTMLVVSILFSVLILMIRVKITHSIFLLFLVWNLFLATIPYFISTYLLKIKNKVKICIGFLSWLVFLPNAPYLLTDLIHLRLSTHHFIWIDILVITSFASSGLLILYLSILDMNIILKKHLKEKPAQILISTVFFLVGFGIYLGRFLRYNSWEVLSNTRDLFKDIVNIITQPSQYYQAWLFTICFGLFLNIGYWVFKSIYTSTPFT